MIGSRGLVACLAVALAVGCADEATHGTGVDTRSDASIDAELPGDGPSDAHSLPDGFVTVRAPGQRTPLSAACDPVDTTRCLLPWPSNTFTVVDTTTPTGLRLNVAQQGIATVDN